MAPPLGTHFIRHCLEPLRLAATKLAQSRLLEAFAALERDRLGEALQAGTRDVAKRAGVPVDTVRQALPHVELAQTMDAIGAAQEQARASLGQFVGSVASLLPGGSPDAKSASEALAALAAKYALDEHIHDPVQGLADHVARWEQLIAAAGEGLSRNASLRAAMLRRLLLRVAAVAVVLALLLVGLAYAGWQRIVVAGARDRIDLLIAHKDPCSGATAAAEDVAHATTEQVARLAEKSKACASTRAREAYVEACRLLGEHVDSRKLTPDDLASSGASAALVQRVASHALVVDDLLVAPDALPCQDTPSGKRLWDAYADAAATSPALWTTAERASDHALAALRARKGGPLDDASREALTARTEVITKRAVTSGLAPELERARALCGLGASLGFAPEPWCKALARIDKKEDPAEP